MRKLASIVGVALDPLLFQERVFSSSLVDVICCGKDIGQNWGGAVAEPGVARRSGCDKESCPVKHKEGCSEHQKEYLFFTQDASSTGWEPSYKVQIMQAEGAPKST
jgi:hypothetical protein